MKRNIDWKLFFLGILSS